ncbi:MAG TPA: PEGA domain-containing protein [Polyangiaceae bacterium]|jgi:hypothetical protein
MRRLALLAVLGCAWLLSSPALADDPRQASKHFQRGVALYGEADYRGALVEFKRAYALAPNPAVLYNVGETQYQLQDYAGALTTFERFLAEAGPGDTRRAEVDGDLEVLRSRVGRLVVTTIPPGADVTIDDQPAVRTPIDRPMLVSVGHRRVVASMNGHPPLTRWVDVAADDSITVTLQLPDSPEAPAGPSSLRGLPTVPPDTGTASHGGGTLRILGWTLTGTAAAGAAVFGVLALRESHDLSQERSTFPASAPALVHDASLTSTYSAVADGLAIGAVVIGGATLLSTLLSHSGGTPARGALTSPQLAIGPGSARLLLSF